MTQGAIDLVQAQLEAPAAAAPPPLLLGAAAAAAAAAAGPHLLQAGPADSQAAQLPPLRPVQQYSWVDAGSTVRIWVPVAQLRLGLGNTSARTAEVCCEVQPHQLELTIRVVPPLALSPALQEFSFSPSCGKVGSSVGSGAAAPPGPVHQLSLHPLPAPVVPTRCRCFVEGPPALLPCSSSGSLSSGEEQGRPHTEDDQAAREAVAAPPLLSIHFCLPAGSEALVVELAKADPQQQWELLQATTALLPARTPAAGGGSPGPPPDLADLRQVPPTPALHQCVYLRPCKP